MALLLPRSTTIHDPTSLCDHLVSRLLSKAFCGIASSPSSPITENRDIGRLSLHVSADAMEPILLDKASANWEPTELGSDTIQIISRIVTKMVTINSILIF